MFNLTKINFISLLLIVILSFSCASKTKKEDQFTTPAKINFLTWPGSDYASFGCILEKDFNHDDPTYKCSLEPIKTKKEICKSEESFFSGPIFPRPKTTVIHPFINDISLFWEGGKLQSMIVTLDRILEDITVKNIFKIPDISELPKNIKSITFQECKFGSSCIYIEGFEHIGREICSQKDNK